MSSELNMTEENQQWTAEDLTLLILYCCSSIIGTVANIFVIMGIVRQNMRSRNILLLSLCASDLMVCMISMPLSVFTALVRVWTMSVLICKATYFFQSLPVAASTTSLMMLALDRYATLKQSRILKFRSDRMIITVWTGAAFVTSPILYARQVTLQVCCEIWPSDTIRTAFVVSHVVIVYLIPCVTVASCHFTVGRKLCVSSQPPLPLPIPLIRRPQPVIVVTSVLPDESPQVLPHRNDGDGSSSEDEARNRTRPQLLPGRQVHTLPNQDNENRKRPPLIKQISRQSLHSRRRLANMLIAMVVVFAMCWAPYIVIVICCEAGMNISSSVLPFCLLLGHTHSAINPLVYYLTNRQSLRITTSCSFNCRCNRSSDTGFDHPPSSTNEAALGVFHPCYTTKRFQPRGGCTNDYL